MTSLEQLNLEKAFGEQLASEVRANLSASANSRLRTVFAVLFNTRALGIKASCWWWVSGSSCSYIIDRPAGSTRRFVSIFAA